MQLLLRVDATSTAQERMLVSNGCRRSDVKKGKSAEEEREVKMRFKKWEAASLLLCTFQMAEQGRHYIGSGSAAQNGSSFKGQIDGRQVR